MKFSFGVVKICSSHEEYEAAEQAYGTGCAAIIRIRCFSKKSLYKYGWTQFKQSRYLDALASYTQLLDINLEQGNICRKEDFNPDRLPRADQELLEDVTRVLSHSAFSYQEEKFYISRITLTMRTENVTTNHCSI